MATFTLYVDADTLGTDSEYPEAFAQYCEERLEAAYPDAAICIEHGFGRDQLPAGVSAQELWDDYCSLPAAEYRRLSAAVPAARRAGYLAAVND